MRKIGDNGTSRICQKYAFNYNKQIKLQMKFFFVFQEFYTRGRERVINQTAGNADLVHRGKLILVERAS